MADQTKSPRGDAWDDNISAKKSSKRPAPEGFESWPDYWKAHGTSWRTEPEIDDERQHFLAERRKVRPDVERGIYPFRDETGGIELDRVDIEWLLATHESSGMAGPVGWDDIKHRRSGLDLRGALLNEVDLSGLPLAGLVGGATQEELAGFLDAVDDATSDLSLGQIYRWLRNLGDLTTATDRVTQAKVGAKLSPLFGEGSQFQEMQRREEMAAIHLEGSGLTDCHLEGAHLPEARLKGADLSGANMQEANLVGADLTKLCCCPSIWRMRNYLRLTSPKPL